MSDRPFQKFPVGARQLHLLAGGRNTLSRRCFWHFLASFWPVFMENIGKYNEIQRLFVWQVFPQKAIWDIWVCLKMLGKPHCTQWFCWSDNPVLKNGYFIGKINPTFSDKAIYSPHSISQTSSIVVHHGSPFDIFFVFVNHRIIVGKLVAQSAHWVDPSLIIQYFLIPRGKFPKNWE